MLVMLPLYIVGARYYECGDKLVKTTSAYLADAVEIEGVVAVALIVVAISSVVFAAHFRTTFGMKRHADEQLSATNDDADPDNAAAAETGNRHHPFLLFLLWMSSLALLSFPSFVYGLTTAVPTKDSIFGPWYSDIAFVVQKTAPIIITLINSFVVPAVVVYCCDRSTWQSARLLLVSRLMTT